MTIYAYCRRSNDEITTENQIQYISKHFQVDKFFSEEKSGALPAEKRPVLQEVLALLKKDDVLVVYAIDRLGRDMLEAVKNSRLIHQAGAKLISAIEGMTFADDVGELQLAMLSWAAQFERNRLIRRTKDGIARFQAQHGKSNWGQGRKGTTFAPRIHELLAEGRTQRDVAKEVGCSLMTVTRAVRAAKSMGS